MSNKKYHWITICNELYVCPFCKRTSKNKDTNCHYCGTSMYSYDDEKKEANESLKFAQLWMNNNAEQRN